MEENVYIVLAKVAVICRILKSITKYSNHNCFGPYNVQQSHQDLKLMVVLQYLKRKNRNR